MLKKILWGLVFISVIILCILYYKVSTLSQTNQHSPQFETVSASAPPSKQKEKSVQIGGPFKLTNHLGKIVTDQDLRGKITLIYFGYTYCPDVCPMALTNIEEALKELKNQHSKIQVVFITVDPIRDTQEHMKEFIENYGPNFFALTGSSKAIEKAKNAYHVYAQHALETEGQEHYLVDHSSIVYVMGQDGKFLTSFNHQTTASEIIKILKPYL